jgi:arginase
MGLPGTSKEEIPEFGWIEPVLSKERLVYIGLRDIDEGERKILKENSELISLSVFCISRKETDPG